MPLPSPPPQVLPITAEWCLDAPSAAEPARCIQLEVARTPQQQQWGLIARPPLPAWQGMLFPFQPPRPVKFWMHRTPAALDMLFLRDGQVIAIEAGAQPCPRLPCRNYGPEASVDGVVELGAGQAAALGLRVGSRAVIQAKGSRPPR